MSENNEYFKGRGSQIITSNPFHKHHYASEHIEGLDEERLDNTPTQYFYEHPKKVVNKVDSPDLGLEYSINPYQGCEHGCIYCYARNSHQYWGYSAGLDFERKIIVKENAPQMMRKQFDSKNWVPKTVMLSGNTDCYQPVEKKLQITRKLLEVFLEYKHPVGIITKNALVQRDVDLLKELAKDQLVSVTLSITTLNEKLRQVMEPRTASAKKRLETLGILAENGIPVSVMAAPIIPGLNNHEIPQILKKAAEAGATGAGYTVVRLNGAIGEIFRDWVRKNFPDRADKILNLIKECHGGNLNDSQWGRRMRGDGNISESIKSLFEISKQKYFGHNEKRPPLRTDLFRRPEKGQLRIF